MALTVAKSLPAGLHLYNTLTGETLVQKILEGIRLIYVTNFFLV